VSDPDLTDAVAALRRVQFLPQRMIPKPLQYTFRLPKRVLERGLVHDAQIEREGAQKGLQPLIGEAPIAQRGVSQLAHHPGRGVRPFLRRHHAPDAAGRLSLVLFVRRSGLDQGRDQVS